MADGGLTIELNEALSARLEQAARLAGQTPAEYAASPPSDGLDLDWSEDYARYAEYKRTGDYVDAEVAMAGFTAALAARFSEQR